MAIFFFFAGDTLFDPVFFTSLLPELCEVAALSVVCSLFPEILTTIGFRFFSFFFVVCVSILFILYSWSSIIFPCSSIVSRKLVLSNFRYLLEKKKKLDFHSVFKILFLYFPNPSNVLCSGQKVRKKKQSLYKKEKHHNEYHSINGKSLWGNLFGFSLLGVSLEKSLWESVLCMN